MSAAPANYRLLNSAIETLAYLQSRICMWIRRVENYKERTKLMINLFFSIASQADNRTNMEIADLTAKIAVDAQRDSSSMITIAAVTMVFLPGTFISVRRNLRTADEKGCTNVSADAHAGYIQHGFLQR